MGESGGGSVFFDFCWAVLGRVNAPGSSFIRRQTRCPVTAVLCCPPPSSFPPLPGCFSPPSSRLLLLSSGYGAKRLSANREGLPWETEKGGQRGAWGYIRDIKKTFDIIN